MFEEYLDTLGRIKRSQPANIKQEFFIYKAIKKHGNRYDYSLVTYVDSRTKVCIKCPEHGIFWQEPGNHIHANKVNGCKLCGNQAIGQNRTIEEQEVLQRFYQVHKDTYNYSKVKYVAMLEKVEIICKSHGSFLMRPNDHERGSGCPKCQGHNQNTLYLLKCPTSGLIKIGITNNITRRISEIGGKVFLIKAFTLDNPRILESSLHLRYSDLQVYNPYVKQGHYEFFQLSDEQLEQLVQELIKL